MKGAPKVPDEFQQILAEVCAEYRVRIDPDDPAVAVMVMNRLVLEAAVNRALERIDAATASLNEQVEAIQLRAGAAIAQELRNAVQRSMPNLREASGRPNRNLIWVSVGVFVAGLFVGFLVT